MSGSPRALDLPVRSVRLVAGSAVTVDRLRRRYTAHRGDALRWHLGRHEELAAGLARADLDELVVDTERLSPRAVAERVLRHFGIVTQLSGSRTAANSV